MEIALLGWGSLTWDPGELRTNGTWYTDGPLLPVEFARVTRDERLTLVLYPDTEPVRVLWSRSSCASLDEAAEDLAARVGTSADNIGYVSFFSSVFRCNTVLEALGPIHNWGNSRNLDAVIWTDLPPNFEDLTRMLFTPDNVITYLRALKDDSFDKAKDYILNAPEQVSTPVRRHIQNVFRWQE